MIKVEMTQADIDAGLKGNCSACPVAIALNRATGDTWHVAGTYCRNLTAERYYSLPWKVSTFIGQFDCAYDVQPITIELDESRSWTRADDTPTNVWNPKF